MPIPDGGMRLHWDAHDGAHLYEDFFCLDDALARAGKVYAADEGTLTRLENWLGEDACPANQLLPIAQLRADSADRNASHKAMEASPIYGQF